MAQIKTKIEITIKWWNNSLKEIPSEHISDLEDDANYIIGTIISKGYTSGELYTEVKGIYYKGFWELKMKRS